MYNEKDRERGWRAAFATAELSGLQQAVKHTCVAQTPSATLFSMLSIDTLFSKK